MILWGGTGRSAREHFIPGFSLLEIFVVLAMIGIVFTTAFITSEGLIERWNLNIATGQVVQTLKYAQFLSLTQRHTHEIVGAETQLWIKKQSYQLEETPWESLSANLVLTANRWPSFSPYGFAKAGTIFLESTHFSTQIKVSSIGSIRHTEIESK